MIPSAVPVCENPDIIGSTMGQTDDDSCAIQIFCVLQSLMLRKGIDWNIRLLVGLEIRQTLKSDK